MNMPVVEKSRASALLYIREPPLRGAFYGNIAQLRPAQAAAKKLVFDIEKFHLHIDPESIPSHLKERNSS